MSSSLKLTMPEITELKPRITVFGVGGAGGNAVNNMILSGLAGVDFVVANTDAQALTMSRCERIIQMGVASTEGLGAGSHPEVGAVAAEEVIDEIRDQLSGSHMIFVTAGMGGGTGTGAAPVIARAARELGILTVGVVTKPFQFEGQRRMRIADDGIDSLAEHVDTLIVIPNQNLFRVANEKTTFADAFAMADQVLYSGVACITDLMVKEGLINLDFADVRAVMREMGKAMMGTGEASGEKRATQAAEAAISNPLLDDVCMRGARGLLISITGGRDLTLFEVDEAASRIRQEVDGEANIILGATFDESLEGIVRVSVVATGIESDNTKLMAAHAEQSIHAITEELRQDLSGQPSAPAPAREIPLPPQPAHELDSQNQGTGLSDAIAIRRKQPTHSHFEIKDVTIETPQPVEQPSEQALGENFIPPEPERTERHQPRLPRVEDFPPIAQDALRAHYADETDRQTAGGSREEQKSGLFGRIAAGLGIREGDNAESPAQPAMQVQPDDTPSHEENPYAKPPTRQGAQTAQGQAAAQQRLGLRPVDDDELEIPAFLRRQAN